MYLISSISSSGNWHQLSDKIVIGITWDDEGEPNNTWYNVGTKHGNVFSRGKISTGYFPVRTGRSM